MDGKQDQKIHMKYQNNKINKLIYQIMLLEVIFNQVHLHLNEIFFFISYILSKIIFLYQPTLSLGIICNSAPYFKNTWPAFYCNETPVPLLDRIAHVDGFTLNSSATYLTQAANGASSGTLNFIVC